MAAETLPYENGVVANGDLSSASNSAVAKNSRESERRRRRRKQKKNKASQEPESSAAEDGEAEDTADDDAKENTDPQQVLFVYCRFWPFNTLVSLISCTKLGGLCNHSSILLLITGSVKTRQIDPDIRYLCLMKTIAVKLGLRTRTVLVIWHCVGERRLFLVAVFSEQSSPLFSEQSSPLFEQHMEMQGGKENRPLPSKAEERTNLPDKIDAQENLKL